MTTDEFQAWLYGLVEAEELDSDAAAELIYARNVFDDLRVSILAELQSPVVGVARGRVLVADSVPEILAVAQNMEALVYFERMDDETLTVAEDETTEHRE